jgi:hypothetical protein
MMPIPFYRWGNILERFSSTSQSTRNFSISQLLRGARELWRLDTRNPFLEIPEAWVTSLDEVEESNNEIIQLHPGIFLKHRIQTKTDISIDSDVFRVTPRLDLLHRNVTWFFFLIN